jgi:hypothetical protein
MFLAYFPKMKVGYQITSLCVSVSPTKKADFHEIWYRGNVIQEDLDEILFNPISQTILKLLRFKV